MLTAQQARPIFLQIIEGIKTLHENYILHRDITPGNLALRPDGKIKVLDFGIGKQVGVDVENTVMGMVSGTPQYMAPEVFAGGPATAHLDLWSLGLPNHERTSVGSDRFVIRCEERCCTGE